MLSSHDAKHGKHQEGDYQADGNDDKRVKPNCGLNEAAGAAVEERSQ